MIRHLSAAQARRVAIAAQGLGRADPSGRIDIRHLRRVLGDIHVLQIDSVNVLARAHYMPLYSRLGPYPAALLEDMAYRRRELFEYWAHEASYVPVAHQPLLRHRMHERRMGAWTARLEAEAPGYIDAVAREVAERGPLSASELSDPGDAAGKWWGWSKGKIALEWLFATGRVMVADRRGFTRLYDLTERVLPAEVLAIADPDPGDARRQLVLLAARALGVATAVDLADYWRQKLQVVRPLVRELADEGLLQRVEVDGWADEAYLHPQARVPRKVETATLLSPFDPLVWDRARTERLFGFHYRIEIYVPEARRVHGYYVLPFLLDDALVARVDLKADRTRGVLLVRTAWQEHDPSCAGPLADELRRMATWLGLDAVEVAPVGDLAADLSRALAG